MSVRVRFAPSPTGSLHLGGALTALVNRLFASSAGGTMLLRIDDTDTPRTVEDAERELLHDLRWLGIGWDEGPIRQSERFERYRAAAAGLPDTRTEDGAVVLAVSGLRPFVLIRGDGRATYRWASVVDDADLGITHVIRGGDHLANRPLQEAAFRALGAPVPAFVHHAIVLGERGKLSKREGGATVAELRAQGYPAAAIVNQLGLVASSGPGEVLSLEQLVARFDPARLARGEVRLEQARLDSLAAAHLAALGDAELAASVLPFCPPGTPPDAVAALAPALRGAHTLVEAAALVGSVLAEPEPHPLPELAEIRRGYPERLSEQQARRLVDELRRRGVPLKRARLALTGRERGPELWAVLAALTREQAIRRAA
jgi:glutamyl-tRNA synthetase